MLVNTTIDVKNIEDVIEEVVNNQCEILKRRLNRELEIEINQTNRIMQEFLRMYIFGVMDGSVIVSKKEETEN